MSAASARASARRGYAAAPVRLRRPPPTGRRSRSRRARGPRPWPGRDPRARAGGAGAFPTGTLRDDRGAQALAEDVPQGHGDRRRAASAQAWGARARRWRDPAPGRGCGRCRPGCPARLGPAQGPTAARSAPSHRRCRRRALRGAPPKRCRRRRRGAGGCSIPTRPSSRPVRNHSSHGGRGSIERGPVQALARPQQRLFISG